MKIIFLLLIFSVSDMLHALFSPEWFPGDESLEPIYTIFPVKMSAKAHYVGGEAVIQLVLVKTLVNMLLFHSDIIYTFTGLQMVNIETALTETDITDNDP